MKEHAASGRLLGAFLVPLVKPQQHASDSHAPTVPEVLVPCLLAPARSAPGFAGFTYAGSTVITDTSCLTGRKTFYRVITL